MSSYAPASAEPLRYSNGQAELPPRPTKSIRTFLEERENDAWYWRALATLAAFLIMVGFLIFPGAFASDSNESNNHDDASSQQTISITVGALVVINSGYILSVALWFLRKNWIYQLDCIFFPCLMSSIFGFVNSLVVPNLILRTSVFTAPTLAAVIVSVISSVIYGLLCLFTWKRLEKLRKTCSQDLQRSQNPAWKSDEELQRTQWTNLFQTQGETITAAQLQSHRTYHIDPILPPTRNTDPYGAYHNGYGGGFNTM